MLLAVSSSNPLPLLRGLQISSDRLCNICFGLRGSVNSITEVATLLIIKLDNSEDHVLARGA